VKNSQLEIFKNLKALTIEEKVLPEWQPNSKKIGVTPFGTLIFT
tara:strand:- start:88 stop:219 length:132 start_codon:yes stop_codon:yes gene_type:complete